MEQVFLSGLSVQEAMDQAAAEADACLAWGVRVGWRRTRGPLLPHHLAHVERHHLLSQWIPNPPQWNNFREALANPQLPFLTFFRNTLIIEVGMITGRLISCVLVAYGFARLEAPGKNAIFTVLLATLMLPEAVTWIPRFILFSRIGWVNTYLPLIILAWFGEAYAIFLMRQFFMTIPHEPEEAMSK